MTAIRYRQGLSGLPKGISNQQQLRMGSNGTLSAVPGRRLGVPRRL